MALLGGVIKRAINFNGLVNREPNPYKAQRKVLLQLLKKARLTAFGLKYNFTDILASPDPVVAFQQRVPLYDYDRLHNEWWHFLLEGHQNITWPGGQQYFALSSGTTSNKKYIPVTDDMIAAIRKSGIQQVMSLKNFDLPPDFFTKDILMLGSSTSLIQQIDHQEGEISGISAANIPGWFGSFYKPGIEIASIENWDEKVRRIAQEAPKWDVGSISGIPSWVELMLQEVIRHNRLNNIHDIWPNLQVYTSGGVAFEPYRKSMEKLLARPLTYIDTYLASEGYLATQKRPDTDAMALILNNGVFFEFVPFEEFNINEDGSVKEGAPVLTLEQAQEGEEYVLLISTVSGAWRYMIGDTVIITDKKRSEIRISGRTKHYLNVVGEQLSVQKMNAAIEKLEEVFDIEVKEFVASTVLQDEQFIMQWVIGTDKEIDRVKAAEIIDTELVDNNKNYAVARTKALKGVAVEAVPVAQFYNWSETYKKLGGQAKIPRVMKEEDFREFREFMLQGV
ncbi:GH3 auxin-responsive promoter [Cnuella takakiae]|uniref:GH3 auxin-responsive promoter n=1 Tax=Cnuella takakiae TaxID=1302690 RepID=A0A1M4T4R4_9BACT|nr:GH3 auxin-responsive promoter family protein [Cnuella takakiae]OLY90676.1 GH3 auxin-responsive promoter [Cnuella takakiae]SHE39348.1 GH3 auxin-responsive promoter [Cnuella takakiae]